MGYNDSHGTASRVFASFLTWLQEKTKPVFVIATANDVSALPPELLRKGRFDEIFFVDLPTKQERTDIFKIHLLKRNKDVTKFDLAANILNLPEITIRHNERFQMDLGELRDKLSAISSKVASSFSILKGIKA